MDRISHLPECIVHHILSCSPAEVVRMSVLSKTWFHLTASFPILDFNFHLFTHHLHLSRLTFFNYLDYTTSKFCHQNVTAQRFKLVTTLNDPAESDIVNRCLELLFKNGVNVLEVNITHSLESAASTSTSTPKYRLPNILLSVSVLKSLTVRWCDLPSSLMFDDVKFKSLTLLKLQGISIDHDVIKYLTTSFPLLQDLHILCCYGFKRFCVYGHRNLQLVRIFYDHPLKRIDIQAPNLSTLFVVAMNKRGPPQMDFASCKKLTTVTYNGHPLPNLNAFTNFLSNFPFIQNLVLVTKHIYKLSSHSLRTLVLYSVCDLEDIEFRTPNLVLFIYVCNSRLLDPMLTDERWPLLRDSTHMKACMRFYPDGDIDSLCFQKLRRFLDRKSGFKVLNLYIHSTCTQRLSELEKLKAIKLPPYELEHVELQLETHEESSDYAAFVDAVLWCCRPRSLTLRSSVPLTGFEEHSDLVKFTYEKLLQQEDEGHTKIQIVLCSSSKAQKQFMYFKSSSMALPRERKTICFIKEEVV